MQKGLFKEMSWSFPKLPNWLTKDYPVPVS